jgi:hypothetical protein
LFVAVCVLVSPMAADYFFAVILSGSDYDAQRDGATCSDVIAGFVGDIWCLADGYCHNNIIEMNAGAEVVSTCLNVPVYDEVYGGGDSYLLYGVGNAVRSDDIYAFTFLDSASCDYGVCVFDYGTNPFPC